MRLIMLDIIIPTYNDVEGLRRSLQSISFKEFKDIIHITVVDDASQNDYSSIILQEFPNIQWLKTNKNGGPGAARNFARKHTIQPYILFIDCGDIIYSKYCLLEIIDTILNEPNYPIYSWAWVDSEYNIVKSNKDPSTPGKIYNRKFLEDYNLWQCEGQGSYAGEDMSLNRACKIILNEDEYKYLPTPIYAITINDNSITHKNNKEFMWKQTPGFIENIIHFIKLCEYNNVINDNFIEQLDIFMGLLYHQFLLGIDKDVLFVKSWWEQAHNFYLNSYLKYENYTNNDIYLSMAQSRCMKGLAYVNKTGRAINLKKFLQELKNSKEIPIYYLNK